ncbi:bifunctional diaminohydroxyphosphoribosylaminopyrimidine deaminase/5-amino-6-(5-phosphoribosylamino)uracil reductase RibD [Gangjinia marincola]|uniref:Riboflavin biosynthesis protein RibD n=1 Tax=Gangjinia marincola TaxID=578463 RepID=A0ABP3XQN9_9FLAO
MASTDEIYMKRCLQLAKLGLVAAMPNPSVGCVIVVDKMIVAEGYTSPHGGPHAEVNAIRQVTDPELLKKATLYVSLEPCNHFGKTPPCSDLIVKSDVKKVVIGAVDSNEKVAGTGIKKLRDHGIKVITGVLEKECRALNRRFFTYHEKKRPYVTLKWAQTKDGYIAPPPYQRDKAEPVWITNPYSRQIAHQLRVQEMGIMVGGATLAADNPSLTARDWFGRSPTRIVFNTKKTLDPDKTLFDGQAETLVLTTVDIETRIKHAEIKKLDPTKSITEEILDILYHQRIQSILVEGGTKTLKLFIDTESWDEAHVFTGPHRLEDGVKAPAIKHEPCLTHNVLRDVHQIYYNDQEFSL